MESKYIPAIAALLAGLVVWIALVVWRKVTRGRNESPVWLEPAMLSTAAGLVLFSGFA